MVFRLGFVCLLRLFLLAAFSIVLVMSGRVIRQEATVLRVVFEFIILRVFLIGDF